VIVVATLVHGSRDDDLVCATEAMLEQSPLPDERVAVRRFLDARPVRTVWTLVVTLVTTPTAGLRIAARGLVWTEEDDLLLRVLGTPLEDVGSRVGVTETAASERAASERAASEIAGSEMDGGGFGFARVRTRAGEV